MLKTVDVYSTLGLASTLTFDEDLPVESDFVQVKNIDGLDPVKANIDTVAASTRDGLSSIDTSVPSRNIVMTLRPNPDWSSYTAETLRKFLYSYFIPKNRVKLVFDSDEVGVVEISGVVESCDANPFSKDPEYVISIICEDPYFTAVEATVVTGSVISPEDWETLAEIVHIDGTVPVGFKVSMSYGALTRASMQVADPAVQIFTVVYHTDDTVVFQMNSVPGEKFVRTVDSTTGHFTNILKSVMFGSVWPMLQPGDNKFSVVSPGLTGLGYTWELSCFEKFGGI